MEKQRNKIIFKILDEKKDLDNEQVFVLINRKLQEHKLTLVKHEDDRVYEITNKILSTNNSIGEEEFYQLLKEKLKVEKIEDTYIRKIRLWNCYCSYHGIIAMDDPSYTSMARKRLRHLMNVVGPHAIRTWSDTP